MKSLNKLSVIMICCVSLIFLSAYFSSTALAGKADPSARLGSANASFDVDTMGDMSDFDPSNPVTPTGDTIKIALVMPFSGPAAVIGETWYLFLQWAAHDYNKRGGIWVDGKKKLIEVIKADNQSKQAITKKVCERMALVEKVHILAGCASTPNTIVLQNTAEKYKIIAHNCGGMADNLMDAQNFNRYTFKTLYDTNQFGKALAYYYGQIRKKEKKFYILCQDYGYGHSTANAFKEGLTEYFPNAQIVGEDYHPLFLKDFAPYLTKIKASNAEVIFTADWPPDLTNLLKQARELAIMIPVASKDMDNHQITLQLGMEGSRNLFSLSPNYAAGPAFKTEQQKKFHAIWHDLWKNKWSLPYNIDKYEYPEPTSGHTMMQMYWLMSVIERAKSTDPEKIINVWENDTFRVNNGNVWKMRACDHRVIYDLSVAELVPPNEQKAAYNIPPYYWFNDSCFTGPVHTIPADKAFPFMDPELDRCKGKNGWGE